MGKDCSSGLKAMDENQLEIDKDKFKIVFLV